MKAGAAKAGMLCAAMLLAAACDRGAEVKASALADEPVRRANFRSLAAQDFLLGCTGGATRAETVRQIQRFQELMRFARGKGADHALWLGANDWAALAPRSGREPCEPGEEAYGQALAAFSGTLDTLGDRIATYRGGTP